jgi:pimeloyl-ACP methyl ester carboxylesterase
VTGASLDEPRASQTLRLPDGRALGFAEHGAPDGAPVFHMHGWPGSRWQGARYDAAARAAGVRLVTPERPGFGLSDPRPGRRVTDWPADVAALATALGLRRFAVLGVSGGGPYALACAVWLAERVTRVALVSSVAPPDAPGWTARQRTLALLARVPPLLRLALRGAARAVARDAAGALERAWRRLPAVDQAIVRARDISVIAITDSRAAFADGGRAAAQEARLLLRPWGLRLDELRVPIELWHGAADTVVPPAMGRCLAATLPNCRARFLPEEGHYLVIPRAQEILGSLTNDM